MRLIIKNEMANSLKIELVIDEETSIFLTSDGSENGLNCKFEIPNLENLQRESVTVTEKSANGKNIRQTFAETDKEFEINVVTWVYRSVWESIRALRDADIEIIITENKEGVWTEIFNREVSITDLSASNPVNDRFHKPSMKFTTI